MLRLTVSHTDNYIASEAGRDTQTCPGENCGDHIVVYRVIARYYRARRDRRQRGRAILEVRVYRDSTIIASVSR